MQKNIGQNIEQTGQGAKNVGKRQGWDALNAVLGFVWQQTKIASMNFMKINRLQREMTDIFGS